MAFFRSSDPAVVLDSYVSLVGSQKTAGMSAGALSVADIRDPAKTAPRAHIEAGPYVHPVIAEWVAKALGYDVEAILQVAAFEAAIVLQAIVPVESYDEGSTGPMTLQRELEHTETFARLRRYGITARDLVFTKIPVPPAAARPAQVMPGGHKDGGPAAQLLERLCVLGERYRRGGTREDRQYYDYQVQHAFQALWAYYHKGTPIDLWSIEAPTGMEAAFISEKDIEKDFAPPEPLDVAFLEGTLLLVQHPTQLLTYDYHSQQVVRTFDTPPLLFQGLSPDRRTALFGEFGAIGQLDLSSGKWVSGFRKDLHYILEWEEFRQAFLYDARTTATLALYDLNDYPKHWPMTPDRKYIWTESADGDGGIYALQSGLRVARAAQFDWKADFPRWPDAKSSSLKDEAAAICLRNNKWLMYRGGKLLYGGQPIFQIDFPATAAAFSADGNRLFLTNAGHALIIHLEKGLDPSPLPPKDLSVFEKVPWEWDH